MRTVWTRELINGSSGISSSSSSSNNDQKEKMAQDVGKESAQKQRSVTDLVNEVSKSDGVLKMSIGESEFLSQSLNDEFRDVIPDRFGDLSGVLMQWHGEGQSPTQSKRNISGSSIDDYNNMGMSADTNVLDTNKPAAVVEAFGVEEQQQPDGDEQGQSAQKFCVFCGEKIPVVAKLSHIAVSGRYR